MLTEGLGAQSLYIPACRCQHKVFSNRVLLEEALFRPEAPFEVTVQPAEGHVHHHS